MDTITSPNASANSPAAPANPPVPAGPPANPPAPPAADPKPAAVEYKLTPPSGSSVDESTIKGVTEFAKAHGLSQEQAQKLLEREVGTSKAFTDNAIAKHNEARAKWVNEAKSDKEIGGTAFDASVTAAKKAITKYATPELKKLLNETGFGDHPEVIRLFARIGKADREDTLVTGQATPPAEQKSREQRFYPSMAKQ